MSWTPASIPDQSGRTALVTGTTVGGLGHYTALELSRAGATVVLAGRTDAKLVETAATIRAEITDARLERLAVDMASLDSVRSAAGRAEAFGPLHLLVNNAGIMATPYKKTPDGFESQLATNHFGPFLLTGLLLPQLLAGGGDSRVIAVSSMGHRIARKAPLGDPRKKARYYSRWQAYGESKLANLLFTFELDRRLRSAELPVKALAAHPGYSGTHLVANGRFGRSSGGLASIFDVANRAIGQAPAMGAWPTLMAATDDLPGATYVGPSGLGEMGGSPQVVGCSARARDEDLQRRMWEVSEQATEIAYP